MTPETPVAHPDSPVQVQPAADNVEQLGDWKEKNKKVKEERKQQKMTKLQLKQAQIYQERRQRLLNKGVDPKKVDMILAAEDYAKLPTDKKLMRLEMAFQRTVQQLAQEIHNLRYNDGVIADAMDVNFKAFAKMLAHLGLPIEKHHEFVTAAQKEMEEEKVKAAEARAAQAKLAAEEQEKKKAEEALKAAENPSLAPEEENEEAAASPEGATEFGG